MNERDGAALVPGSMGLLGQPIPKGPEPPPPPSDAEKRQAVEAFLSAFDSARRVMGAEWTAKMCAGMASLCEPPKKGRGRPKGKNQYDSEALLTLYDRLRVHPDLLHAHSSQVRRIAARLEFRFQGNKAGNSVLAIQRRLERALKARAQEMVTQSERLGALALAAGYPNALAMLAAALPPRGLGLLNAEQ